MATAFKNILIFTRDGFCKNNVCFQQVLASSHLIYYEYIRCNFMIRKIHPFAAHPFSNPLTHSRLLKYLFMPRVSSESMQFKNKIKAKVTNPLTR